MSATTDSTADGVGVVRAVSGPVVTAERLTGARLYDLVHVGERRLLGEVIRLVGDRAVIQVYESTTGLSTGDPVIELGHPLRVELGPGLLGGIFDGTQRPLTQLARDGDDPHGRPMLPHGGTAAAIDRRRRWDFRPAIADGDEVGPGDLIGEVQETAALAHRVLVPAGLSGVVTAVHTGSATVEDTIATIGDTAVAMLRHSPVRRPRPHAGALSADVPLITGQRIIDTLFPVARGGAATIPGGFGTGKTVLETSLAKWSDADVVIYVACGERGNELAEVLEEFPALEDPRTGAPLMGRTVLIANTSNMPVAAREASVYTGITIAEFFRDQGYDVALMADSTSRWGEALREVSGRLEEVPGEEGYPAYLATRLAEFYERAGRVCCLGADERRGSITIIGAVSPPGGDFSEPVTQHSLRLAGAFWALDAELARQRHYPAIDPARSYTLYPLAPWFAEHCAGDWEDLRRWAFELLADERRLLELVALLGADALDPSQRITLRAGRTLREVFLAQSAFDAQDAHTPPQVQHAMLRSLERAHKAMVAAVDAGTPPDEVLAADSLQELGRMRAWKAADATRRSDELVAAIEAELAA
jgi:V/A-type H+-transporting ATPase subunit A